MAFIYATESYEYIFHLDLWNYVNSKAAFM